MPEERKATLRLRLFTLLVLIFCVFAFSNGGLIREAEANQWSEIMACGNTFDNGLNTCINNLTTCEANCTYDNTCGSCGPTFGACFGSRIETYDSCLSNTHFTLDMCYAARDAADTCNASYYHCLDVAQTDEQLGDCMNTFFECRNASGIDQCQ